MKWSVDPAIRAVRYRANRRGSKELDLILGAFAGKLDYHSSPEILQGFHALLSRPEPELYQVLISGEPMPSGYSAKMQATVKTIRAWFTVQRAQLSKDPSSSPEVARTRREIDS